MAVPGWRDMDQEQLSNAIEQKLHEGRNATAVVAMRAPVGELRGWRAIATAPMLLVYLTSSLSVAERCAWITYVWGLALLGRKWRQRRRQVVSDPVPAAI